MTACARCAWRSTTDAGNSRAQLVEHAVAAGHPLCPVPKPTHSDPDAVCGRSLSSTDPTHSCEGCLTQVRADLAVIRDLYAELPAHLRTVPGSALGGARGGDGRPLPGGVALALLANGSMGGASRFCERRLALALATPARWWVKGAHGPLSEPDFEAVERQAQGREHQADNRPDDTASVHIQLFGWVEDWREMRGEVA